MRPTTPDSAAKARERTRRYQATENGRARMLARQRRYAQRCREKLRRLDDVEDMVEADAPVK